MAKYIKTEEGYKLKVGESTAGTVYFIDEIEVAASEGAEVFNDYTNNIASGRYSHAEGNHTQATGNNSHVEGYETIASGINSHAEGQMTTASGDHSHAEGTYTQATGDNSHVEGCETIASGINSHAEGDCTQALGKNSHASGKNTIANTSNEYVIGQYNIESKLKLGVGAETSANIRGSSATVYRLNSEPAINQDTGYFILPDYTKIPHTQIQAGDILISGVSDIQTTYSRVTSVTSSTSAQTKYRYIPITIIGEAAFVVGNGTSISNRSNAHTLDWDGNAWYQGDVYVGGTSQDDSEKLLKESDGLLIADMGLSIKQIPIAAPNRICNIAYGNGRFIALPCDDTTDVFYSDDFMTWKKSTMPFSSAWCSITYGNGIFVAGAENTTQTAWSSDGINWNSTGATTYGRYYYYIVYGNGVFVAVDYTDHGGIYYGAGKIWQEATSVLSTKRWGAMTFGNDKFVMIEVQPGFSYSRKVAYSNDGRIWTEKTLPNEAQWCSIAYGKEQYIAVARGSNQIAYSADGDTWNIAQLPVVVDSPTIVWGDDKFIIADSNVILYSTDGITWNSAPLSSSYLWYSIIYSEDKFVAYVAIDGIKRMIHSADGITWSYTYETIAQNNEDVTEYLQEHLLSNAVIQTPIETITLDEIDEICGFVTEGALLETDVDELMAQLED